jgi:hypothetical protein
MTLHAVPPPASPIFRVARGDDGPPADPFVPPSWGRADADGTFGNRFDDPGMADGIPEEGRFRVIYAAMQREGAFAETIAHFRPDLAAMAALRAIRGAPEEPQPLTGVVPARWRQLRGVGRLLLDPGARFVDVTHPDTLAELRAVFAGLAAELGHRDVDLSTITSGDRRLTQRVARYVYERTDDAGRPHFAGLRYVSRHGAAWECWALFADRLVGDRLPVEPVRADDLGLIVAARHLGLTIDTGG